MPALRDTGDLAPGFAADLPDRYEVVRVHGRGGMATVYLAVDRKHDRQVALKVLAPELTAGIGAERFIREIQIAAHLNHPHIVPLLDSGIADGRPYYVMPFVEGESLRERLAREGSLSLEEALRIAGDVAEALAHAHARDVVHRDIKPGNILLTEGAAVVADFGIAAAIDRAPEEHLTRTGHSLGSVGYMSPEQASGDDDVDGRADQYSLACVLFEMLAGQRPYDGKTARAVLGQQLSLAVPSVADFCDSVPGHVEETVTRALAPPPLDRHPDVATFARCLAGAASSRPPGDVRILPSRSTRTLRGVAIGLSLLLALGGVAWLVPRLNERLLAGAEAPQVDTTRYAIFAFQNSSGTGMELSEQERIRLALAEWGGISISVVESPQLQEEVRRTGQRPLEPAEAAEVARAQGAGRMILGRYSVVDDSLSIDVGLYDSEGDELFRASRHISESGDLNAAFGGLVNELLFRGSPPEESAIVVGTRSYPALRAFHFGSMALESWDLARAETNFKLAADLDPGFGRAHLWLALSRAWSDQPSARWQIPSIQADLHREGMTGRDSVMVDAVMAQAASDYGDACALWRSLTQSQPKDYAGWYGLAICLVSDDAVIPDSTSPSALRFRASRHEGLEAYTRAFGLLPSILESFHSDAYESLRKLFFLTGGNIRVGRAPGADSPTHWARPGWQADSLTFIPYELGTTPPGGLASLDRARQQLRGLFAEVVQAWAAAAPGEARARGGVAISLAMLGQPTAIDTLARARTLASSDEERLDLAALEVWLRLGFALPAADTDRLERVRVLADSLLGADGDSLEPALRAALSVVLGRARQAARHIRDSEPRTLSALPVALQSDGHALGIFAVMSGPKDSLLHLERRIYDGVRQLPAELQRQELSEWLLRPVTLSFPDRESPLMVHLIDDWVVEAQQAVADGDSAYARSLIGEAASRRRGLSSVYITPDQLYPEAHLLFSTGGPEAAAALLDPTLNAIHEVDLTTLSDPLQLACLLRAVALRAEIAGSLGTRQEAARWSRGLLTLWSEGDPWLHDLLSSLREYSL